jgi:hypothetical protein
MNDLLKAWQVAKANLAACQLAEAEAKRKYVSALEFYQGKLSSLCDTTTNTKDL